jgi:hypothetical protein
MDERKLEQFAALPVFRAGFSNSLYTTNAFAEPITDSVALTVSYTCPVSCSDPKTHTDAYTFNSAYSNLSIFTYTDTYPFMAGSP